MTEMETLNPLQENVWHAMQTNIRTNMPFIEEMPSNEDAFAFGFVVACASCNPSFSPRDAELLLQAFLMRSGASS